jgi:hypothetical protein
VITSPLLASASMVSRACMEVKSSPTKFGDHR